MARAGTAYIEVQGDFSRLNKQISRVANEGGRRLGRGLSTGTNTAVRSNTRYTRSLNQVSRSTATATKHAERHGRALRLVGRGAAYALGAGGFGGGLFALFDITRKSIDQFRESERVTKLTAAAIKSTGGAANVTAKQVAALSDAISLKTGIDDEVIQTSANLLLTFTNVRNEVGKGNDIFDQATDAVTDMATAMNHGAVPSTSDLHSASLQLGKALQDPIKGMGALRRVGVAFNQTQQDQIKHLVNTGHSLDAQKMILRELRREFGGAAEATKTSGRSLNVTLGNLAEKIGRALAPTINKGAASLNRFVGQMQSGHGAGGRFVDDLNDIWKAAKPVVVFLGRAGLALGRFAAHHKDLTKLAIELALVGKAISAIRGSSILGGLGLVGARGQGTKVGQELATGVETGIATAGGGRFGKSLGRLAPIARRTGRLVIGAALINGLTEAVSHKDKTFGQKLQRFVSGATFGAFPAPRDIDERMRAITQRIQSWRGRALAVNRRGDPGASIIRRRDLKDFDQGQLHMIRGMARLRNVANRTLGPGARLPTKAWLNPGPVTKDLTLLSRGFARLRSNVSGSTGTIRRDSDHNFKLIARSVGVNSRAGYTAAKKNFDLTARAIKNANDLGWISTRQKTRLILHAFRTNFRASAVATQGSMRDVRTAVKRAVDAGLVTAKQGNKLIHEQFVKYLAQFGIKGRLARIYLSGKVPKTKPFDPNVGAGVGIGGNQQGGLVVGGTGTGDKVHLQAMVEPGEEVYVLNRNAAKKRRQLERLNEAVPRFQRGGRLKGYASGGVVALARTLLSHFPGLSASENPAFGGVHAGHAPGSYHYKGQAVDLSSGNYAYMNQAAAWLRGHFGRSLTEGIHNPNLSIKFGKSVSPSFWGASTWAGHANHIHIAVAGALKALGLAGGMGGVSVPKLSRRLVGGPDWAMKGMVQQGLDATRSAAQRRLQRIVEATGGSDAPSGRVKGSYTKGQLKALWIRAGGNPAMANLMAAIALAESGGDPGAGRTHPYHGLWQVGPGGSFDPFTNAKQAVGKLNSQGLGAWETYTNGAYRQFLQRGGLLQRLQGGGLLGQLRGTLHTLTGGKPKKRSKSLKRLLARIKGIKLPKTDARLRKLASDATIFGERADRAQQLSGDGKPAGVLGHTEVEWLHKELNTLWALRNKVLQAMELVERQRKRVAAVLKRARHRYKVLKGLRDKLKNLRRHPHRNHAAIVRLRHHLNHVDPGERVSSALKDKIIPLLRDKAGAISTRRGELTDQLVEIQGEGSSMKPMKRLPATGDVGGTLFDVQARIRELGKPAEPTDTSSADTSSGADSERADLAQSLATSFQQAFQVSQRHYDVFKNLPFGGSFETGGVVAGPKGARRIIEAHGQEVVFTPEQAEAVGSTEVHVHLANGMEWLKPYIRTEIRNAPLGRRAALPGAR